MHAKLARSVKRVSNLLCKSELNHVKVEANGGSDIYDEYLDPLNLQLVGVMLLHVQEAIVGINYMDCDINHFLNVHVEL